MLDLFAEQIFNTLVMLFGNGLLSDITDFLETVNSATSTALGGGIIADAIAIFKGLGSALVILFFLIELLNETQRDMLTFERLIVMIIRLLAVTVIIMNLESIVIGIEALSSQIFSTVKTMATGASSSFSIFGQNASTGYQFDEIADNMRDALDAGLKDSLSIILQLLLPWIISRLSFVCAYVVSVGRSLELIARAIFSPIGVAQLFEDGTRSSGMRYLKKFAACAMQLAVIAIILYAAGALNNSLVPTFGSGYMTINADNIMDILINDTLWTMSAIQFSVIGLILKSQGICNDILGV